MSAPSGSGDLGVESAQQHPGAGSKKLIGIGCISGSALDGLDIAAVQFEIDARADRPVSHCHLIAADTIPFENELKTALQQAPELDAQGLHALDARYGDWIGERVIEFNNRHDISPGFISSHGYAVFHAPAQGYTVQIGNGAQISQRTGIDVITQLRATDIAAGGQGAPLAPVVEHHCFQGYAFYVNLGGIVNVSVHQDDVIRAWDIGACNQLLNHVALHFNQDYDAGGEIARRGTVQSDLLSQFELILPLPLDKPYGMDNAFVRDHYLLLMHHAIKNTSAENVMRTGVEFIARSIYQQLETFFKKNKQKVLITGGGAHNTFLMERIANLLKGQVEVVIPDRDIINFKEAILIALCGVLRLHNLPNSFASVTGASRDTVNGSLFIGRRGKGKRGKRRVPAQGAKGGMIS